MQAWRALIGMTQAELARLVGSDRPLISMLEVNRSHPSLERLVNIALALGVTTDWLVGLSDVPTPDADEKYPNWRNYVEG
jgi:transcriptional regulator with XRE-family HTH domain